MRSQVVLLTPFTDSHRTAEEALALGYLGSVLRDAGYTVTLMDGWLEKLSLNEMVNRLKAMTMPIVVGMSCYRSNIDQATQLMRAIKECLPDTPVFCGGYGPTFHYDDFLRQGFDAVVIGEAEHVVMRLVQSLEMRQVPIGIPGVAHMSDGDIVVNRQSAPVVCLDDLPYPARDCIQYTMDQRNFVHICTSRGCGGSCSYCSVSAFAKGGSRYNRWRGRSVVNIVDEIEQLYQKYGTTNFKIVDDSFIEPERDIKWAHAFRDELSRRHLLIRFRTQVRADQLTPEIVSCLKDAGWFSTSIGIENAAQTALSRMGKSSSAEQNQVALDTLESHGVYAQMGMILFDPYTTLDELRTNLAFLQRNTWPFTKGIFSEMFAAEGTVFTQQLRKRNLLLDEELQQNLRYEVQDPTVRRVYTLLKYWHRPHTHLYDWVIDTLTAPKVVPDDVYVHIHHLCQHLQSMDTAFLSHAMFHISRYESQTDLLMLEEMLDEYADQYTAIEASIRRHYGALGMIYDAVPNPFLV